VVLEELLLRVLLEPVLPAQQEVGLLEFMVRDSKVAVHLLALIQGLVAQA
jgi:hypothetical protein